MKWRVKNEKPSKELAEKLQHAVLGHLARLNSHAPRNVLNLLSLSLVGLVQQNPSPQMVGQLCNSLNENPAMIPVMLVFLDSLGQEAGYIVSDLQDGVEADRADQPAITSDHPLLVSVRPNTTIVMDLLHHVWNKEPAKTSENCATVMSCFSQWIRFGDLNARDIAASPISQGVFDALQHPDFCKPAFEVIGELSNIVLDDPTSASTAPIRELLSSKVTMIPAFLRPDMDMDVLDYATKSLYRVLRAFSKQIGEVASPDALKMVETAVCAAGIEGVFANSLGFWYRLRTVVMEISNPDQRQRQQNTLKQALLPMLQVLLKEASFPAGAENWKAGDDPEFDFLDTRQKDVADAIEDIAQLIGVVESVGAIFPVFQQSVADMRKWRETEAVLYFISMVISPKHVLAGQLLPKLFENPQQFHASHYRVKLSYMRIVKYTAYWIGASGANYMTGLLGFVVGHCMESVETQSEAIDTLVSLCTKCTDKMVAAFPTLNQMMDKYQHTLKREDSDKINEALASLSCMLPQAELKSAVPMLCAPLLRELQGPGSEALLLQSLNRLKAMFNGVDVTMRYINRNEQEQVGIVWSEAYGTLWDSALSVLISQHSGNTSIMEKLTALCRSVLLACDLAFTPNLEKFVGSMVECFERNPQSCILWVMGSVITVFGGSQQFVGPILGVLTTLISRSVQLLAGSNVGENSDFITEIFYLLVLGLEKFPVAFLASDLAPGAFDVSLAALTNTDVKREALHGVLRFYSSLCGDKQGRGLMFLQGKEERLIEAMMNVVIFRDLDASDTVGDILLLLLKTHKQAALPWIHRGLAALPADVPMEARQKCMEEISRLGDVLNGSNKQVCWAVF